MAIRLAIAFDTTAESWMNQQTQYDLWRASKKRKALEKKVKSLAAAQKELGEPSLNPKKERKPPMHADERRCGI